MRHVFAAKPRFCIGLKPGMIRVRCAKCGAPHLEYFGPRDHDEVRAELELLRRELARAFAILASTRPAKARKRRPRQKRVARRGAAARARK